MTAYELQDDLKTELKSIFKGFQLMTPFLDETRKPKMSEPNVFEQSLPIRENDELDNEQDDDPFPYIIIRVDSGSIAGESSHDVKLRMIIGTYDESLETNGHKDILNIIHKIYERFEKNPVLAEKYVMQDNLEHPFNWALQEEDTYPYYFGAIESTWATTAIRRENKYT